VGDRLLRLATRGSPLARFQAELVAGRLRAAAPGCQVELVVVETAGDRRTDVSIGAFSEHGIFIVEVEQAVLAGRADAAVHSAKDLPAGAPPEGLVLASVPDRADPRDALVGRSLDELASGAVVATGSVRRRAQLAWLRPDLGFAELRGNIATRLDRVPEGGAIVVALAALERLGLEARVAEVLPVAVMLPQIGQGAIAVRCRAGDREALELMAHIDDPEAHRCVLAERAFLARLGGGCDAPVGAHASSPVRGASSGTLVLEGLVASEDGSVVVRRSASGDDPEALGTALAEQILTLDGGADLLERAQRR
jgi:hydroxymethylbilane synthase